MRIVVTSQPSSLNSVVGSKMVGVIFTDAIDRLVPGTYFVPMDNLLKRMPSFENCSEYSTLMEGIYLPKESCRVI